MTADDRAPAIDWDLFAGPGGWDEGVRPLGITPRGVEWDTAACATAQAAGHDRMQADVAQLEPLAFGRVRGLIASPPCQGFSRAGAGRGMADREHLLAALADVHTRRDLEDALARLHATMADDRSLLALEPLRYALALTPSWLAWEQVPGVLPLWEACAAVLRRIGYSVWTGCLHAEEYGVPQTRRRAFLLARSPLTTAQLGPVMPPLPTHSRFHVKTPRRLDPFVTPWRPLSDVMGQRPGWELASSTRPNAPRRRMDQPAQTVAFGNDAASFALVPRGADVRQAKADGTAVRITLEQAAALQTFPAGYPWHGAAHDRYRQIGDAVPPLLAQHVVAAVAGIALPATVLEDAA